MKRLIFGLLVVLPFCALGQSKNELFDVREIMVKMRNTTTTPDQLSDLRHLLSQYGASAPALALEHASLSAQRNAHLSRWYRIQIKPQTHINKLISQLLQLKEIEYAEPYYLAYPLFTPNDSLANSQYALALIRAFEAYDVVQGDTSVMVAIVDSGNDILHPDQKANIAYNYADTINGTDDDNDGFTDNFRGWDMAGGDYTSPQQDNSPNPTGLNNDHGTHVGGIAGAATNNNYGMAGSGYKCRILPIKCAADNDNRASGQGYIIRGYEGIVYAADFGAHIINCSWGGGSYSVYAHDIIKYATNKGSLVVAAAGNGRTDANFYPAAYPEVLSVASVTDADTKSGFSNFGYSVDISAPGSNIISLKWGGGFSVKGGTSMASPLVAGAAALVKSKYPTLKPRALAAHLMNTSLNIDSLNPTFATKLGKGRLDLYRAVTVPLKPFIFPDTLNIKGPLGDVFHNGDTIKVWGTFTNLLADAQNLKVSISSSEPTIQIITPTKTIGMVKTDSSFVIHQHLPLKLVLPDTLSLNRKIDIIITYTDSATHYKGFDGKTVLANPNLLNIDNGTIATSVTGMGRLGYMGNNASTGLGFALNNNQLLYEMGLIIATDADHVVNTVRATSSTYDNDFKALKGIVKLNTNKSDYDFGAVYNDSLAGISKIGLRIRQNSYAFNNAEDNNYLLVIYTLVNTDTVIKNNLHLALFADWDIGQSDANIANFSQAFGTAYAYQANSTTQPYAGIAPLNSPVFCYNMSNDGADGGINVNGGFSDAAKWHTLTNGTTQTEAGGSSGNDISMVVGSGPHSIAIGDSLSLAFVISAAPNLDSLLNTTLYATTRYYNVTASVPQGVNDSNIIHVFPNPTTGLLNLTAHKAMPTHIKLYGLTGNRLLQATFNHQHSLDISTYPKGLYVLQAISGSTIETHKIIVE